MSHSHEKVETNQKALQINLDPTIGREQAGTRPALVFSIDKFNHGPAELVIVLPITSKNKNQHPH